VSRFICFATYFSSSIAFVLILLRFFIIIDDIDGSAESAVDGAVDKG
jgi:hypothetical protein